METKQDIIARKRNDMTMNSKAFDEMLQNSLTQLLREVAVANSEETIKDRFEDVLKEYLPYFDIQFKPGKEVSIRLEDGEMTKFSEQIRNGRIDTLFNYVIHEYKQDLGVNQDGHIKQITEYMTSISKRDDVLLSKLFGVLVDGRSMIFVSFDDSSNDWIITKRLGVNVRNFKELLRVYVSLERKRLSASQLIADFSLDAPDSPTVALAKRMYTRLKTTDSHVFTSSWENLFKLGGQNENNNKTILERKRVLGEIFDESARTIEESLALFALQTTYVLLIKLIANNVMSDTFFVRSNEYGSRFEDLTRLDGESFKSALKRIINGDAFKQVSLPNLIEDDFFSWFLIDDEWDEAFEASLKDIVNRLDEYDSNQRLFVNNGIQDFFKQLYESLIPKEVRHSLGEYYTPDWVADHLLTRVMSDVKKKNQKWRALEPDVGSGTIALKMIENVVSSEPEGMSNQEIMDDILARVHGHDLNPLAVQTAKINYFLAIAKYLDGIPETELLIPISLGDSALVPEVIDEAGIKLVRYETTTFADESIVLKLPYAVPADSSYYSRYTQFVNDLKYSDEAIDFSTDGLGLTDDEKSAMDTFVDQLISLYRAEIGTTWISNVMSILGTVAHGKYDLIASNPPWIDWKVLPDGYREVLKRASLDRNVFSGDRLTGGINLNLSALIANVVADTWLTDNGQMAFLMPKSIVFQQTYTGFRRLTQKGAPLYFEEFVDWTKAGHPFPGVTEKFMSYYFTKDESKVSPDKLPVTRLDVDKPSSIKDKHFSSWNQVSEHYKEVPMVAFQASETNNNFTITEKDDDRLIEEMKSIAGSTGYKGRVGLGLYPKEGMLLIPVGNLESSYDEKFVNVQSYQSTKSERKVGSLVTRVEANMVHPVLEGPDVGRFEIKPTQYLAAFPYDSSDVKKPIPEDELRKIAPQLFKRYESLRPDIKKTAYNQRVQGSKGAFYSITRVGEYTFAPYRVVFRNNTKWNAAVIGAASMPWGETSYLLLDHAASIGQRADGTFITEDEAHYIAAVLNSEIVTEYIVSSSDARSYKTDLPVKVVKYDENNDLHKQLASLSKDAHNKVIEGRALDAKLSSLMDDYVEQLKD